MPQLDVLIFKYESMTFFFFFFSLLYLNQYYIFPTMLKNVFVRRSLISRSVLNENDFFFTLGILKTFNSNAVDNVLFSSTVKELSQNYSKALNQVLNLFSFMRYTKQSAYISLYVQLRLKLLIFIRVNFF